MRTSAAPTSGSPRMGPMRKSAPSAPRSTSRTPGMRQTRPDYSLGMFKAAGGLGPVARRGWDDATARMIALAEQKGMPGLAAFYRTAPLQLLKVLMTVHPMAKMAHRNNVAAACSPGDTQIVADAMVTDPETGKQSKVADADGTACLETFLSRYPGGLPGLQSALLKQLEWAGIFCLEAVPGKRGQGVERAVTFDPMSIYFVDQEDGTRQTYQYATGTAGPLRAAGVYSALPGFDTLLDTGATGTGVHGGDGTILIGGIDYDDDNPYCEPIFGAFLPEGIKDLGQERNLSDILRGVAYPHLMFGFPVEECVAYATKYPDAMERLDAEGNVYSLTPSEYADEEYDKFYTLLTGMNPDDPVLMPKGTEGKVLDASSALAGLDPLLQMRRHRGVMGLDQMPNLLGITDGGTQAYAEEQGKQQAKKLEFIRGLINAAIVWLCNLHLRLSGKNLVARAVTQPVRPADRLNDARARTLEVGSDMDLMDEGLLSPEEVAQRHGTGAVGERKPGGRRNRSAAASKNVAATKTGKSGGKETSEKNADGDTENGKQSKDGEGSKGSGEEEEQDD